MTQSMSSNAASNRESKRPEFAAAGGSASREVEAGMKKVLRKRRASVRRYDPNPHAENLDPQG
jgi:hypothetical protein